MRADDITELSGARQQKVEDALPCLGAAIGQVEEESGDVL